MKKGKSRRKSMDEGNFGLKSSCIACLCGAATSAAMLFLFGLALTLWDLPLGIIGPMAVLALLAGCLSGGFLAARLMDRRGMLWGGICGGSLFAALLLSHLISGGPGLAVPTVTKGVMMVTAGMIGGIFGVNVRFGS